MLACVLVVGGGLLLNRISPVGIARQVQSPTMVGAGDAVDGDLMAPAPLAMEEAAVEPEPEMATTLPTLTAAPVEAAPVTRPTPTPTISAGAAVDEESSFAASSVPTTAPETEEPTPEVYELEQEEGAVVDNAQDEKSSGMAVKTSTPLAAPSPTLSMMTDNALALEAEDMAPGEAPAEAERAAAAPPPTGVTLLEVNNLVLHIEPGMIVITGTLPLEKGVPLSASLWRNGEPLAWAVSEEIGPTVGADGWFSFSLSPVADTVEADLFAVEPATYEVRLVPKDMVAPMEARIPFDTHTPEAPSP
jgi:hypothetical protein